MPYFAIVMTFVCPQGHQNTLTMFRQSAADLSDAKTLPVWMPMHLTCEHCPVGTPFSGKIKIQTEIAPLTDDEFEALGVEAIPDPPVN
jgi:hypothetical protein